MSVSTFSLINKINTEFGRICVGVFKSLCWLYWEHSSFKYKPSVLTISPPNQRVLLALKSLQNFVKYKLRLLISHIVFSQTFFKLSNNSIDWLGGLQLIEIKHFFIANVELAILVIHLIKLNLVGKSEKKVFVVYTNSASFYIIAWNRYPDSLMSGVII